MALLQQKDTLFFNAQIPSPLISFIRYLCNTKNHIKKHVFFQNLTFFFQICIDKSITQFMIKPNSLNLKGNASSYIKGINSEKL